MTELGTESGMQPWGSESSQADTWEPGLWIDPKVASTREKTLKGDDYGIFRKSEGSLPEESVEESPVDGEDSPTIGFKQLQEMIIDARTRGDRDVADAVYAVAMDSLKEATSLYGQDNPELPGSVKGRLKEIAAIKRGVEQVMGDYLEKRDYEKKPEPIEHQTPADTWEEPRSGYGSLTMKTEWGDSDTKEGSVQLDSTEWDQSTDEPEKSVEALQEASGSLEKHFKKIQELRAMTLGAIEENNKDFAGEIKEATILMSNEVEKELDALKPGANKRQELLTLLLSSLHDMVDDCERFIIYGSNPENTPGDNEVGVTPDSEPELDIDEAADSDTSEREEKDASVPDTITEDTRQQLYDRGFRKGQVDKMTPAQAWKFLDGKPKPKSKKEATEVHDTPENSPKRKPVAKKPAPEASPDIEPVKDLAGANTMSLTYNGELGFTKTGDSEKEPWWKTTP